MAAISLSDILRLSVPERIQLVQDIWDSIAAEPEELAFTDAQREELDRRLDDLEANPSAGVPWQEMWSPAFTRVANHGDGGRDYRLT
jgi:putative addiction module component (TIGR02574 family)